MGPVVEADAIQERFRTALENDLDTPPAVGAMDELATAIIAGAVAGRQVEAAQASLRRMSDWQSFHIRRNLLRRCRQSIAVAEYPSRLSSSHGTGSPFLTRCLKSGRPGRG